MFYLKLKNQERLYLPDRKLEVNIISGDIKCMRVKKQSKYLTTILNTRGL